MAGSVNVISPTALAELCKQQKVRLIDVRTPAEFQQVHAKGATNIPLDEFDPATVLNGCEDTIYLICRGGGRVAESLREVDRGERVGWRRPCRRRHAGLERGRAAGRPRPQAQFTPTGGSHCRRRAHCHQRPALHFRA